MRAISQDPKWVLYIYPVGAAAFFKPPETMHFIIDSPINLTGSLAQK